MLRRVIRTGALPLPKHGNAMVEGSRELCRDLALRGAGLLSALLLSAILAVSALALSGKATLEAAPLPQAEGDLTSMASAWVRNDHAAVRLIAAEDRLDPEGRARLGLEFRLAPGWKTYWRSPGDAGLPPEIDWTGSENLTHTAFRWPLPERHVLFGLTTFVYGDTVILPIEAKAGDPSRPLDLRGRLTYLVCETVCIPYEADLALVLPASDRGQPGLTPHAAALAAFEARVPRVIDAESGLPPSSAGLSVGSARLVTGEGGHSLELAIASEFPLSAPDALVEGPPGLIFERPELVAGVDPGTGILRFPVTGTGVRSSLPPALALTVTLHDGDVATEQTVVAPVVGGGGSGLGLVWILALAVLGGLILNLMPCVLPVLSIKLVALVGHGGGDHGAIRFSFLMTAAGILFSFMVLAFGVMAVKAAGMAVGWGLQFQEPLFLAFMAAIITLFAANMFGWLSIPLPGFARGLGAGGDGGSSPAGSFATGAFATLLATPCSAPFLGTAVGFALTRGAGEIAAVFAALGLGLALPYLLVAAWPGLASHLPRPGRWMLWLRRVLGLALLVTAAWLLSILLVLIGPVGAGIVASLLVAGFLVLGLGSLRAEGGWLSRAGLVAVLLAMAIPASPWPIFSDSLAARGASGEAAVAWERFDRVALFNHLAEGRVVLVDVTADWCLTCQVNKAMVLERGAVARVLSEEGVVPMQADWTRPDPAIGRYLSGFGRFGIPFNVVYGPGAPSGIPLPELLSERTVLEALERAAGTRLAGAEYPH